MEPTQQVRNKPAGHGLQERQPYGAAVRIAECGDSVTGRAYFRDTSPSMLEHDLAVGVQPQPPIDPIEQRRTHLAFHPRQSAGQCRLGEVELGGGVGDVLSLSEHDEPLQFVEIHSWIILIMY